MQWFTLSKRLVGLTYAPTGMGSFDSVAVRFANRYYAQDDTSLVVGVQFCESRSGVFVFHN